MMKNRFLKDKIAQDLDKRIARVLKDLGNPDGRGFQPGVGLRPGALAGGSL